MVQSAAATVDEYLASLPEDRRTEIERVREVVTSKLPPGYEEGMLYGMIGWYIPKSRFADTYNDQPLALAGLAAQKNFNALYLMTPYMDEHIERAFRDGFKAAGKKLNMGKSCVRFKSADDLALDVIGNTIGEIGVDSYIEQYKTARTKPRPSRPDQSGKKKKAAKGGKANGAKANGKKPGKSAKPSKPAKKASKPASKASAPTKKAAKPAKKPANKASAPAKKAPKPAKAAKPAKGKRR